MMHSKSERPKECLVNLTLRFDCRLKEIVSNYRFMILKGQENGAQK